MPSNLIPKAGAVDSIPIQYELSVLPSMMLEIHNYESEVKLEQSENGVNFPWFLIFLGKSVPA